MLTALPPKDYHSDTAAVVVDDDDDSGYPKMMRRRGGVGRINNSQWPRTATKAQLQWQNRYRYIIKIYIIVYFRPSLFRTAARSLLRHPVAPVRTVQMTQETQPQQSLLAFCSLCKRALYLLMKEANNAQ